MSIEGGTIALGRHGRTQWNIEGRIQGQADIPLAPESYEEVYRLANSLKETEIPFYRIYTSGLLRTIQTAGVYKEVLGIDNDNVVEQRFNERGAGIYEGLTQEQLAVLGDFEDPSREPKDKFKKRVVEAYDKIVEKEAGNNLLIVAHSAVIKAIKGHIGITTDGLPTPHDEIFLITPNGSPMRVL